MWKSFVNFCKKAAAPVAGLFGFGLSVLQFDSPGVLAVTTAFTDLGVAQVAVGGLLLVAAVTAVTYKWLKGMLFG